MSCITSTWDIFICTNIRPLPFFQFFFHLPNLLLGWVRLARLGKIHLMLNVFSVVALQSGIAATALSLAHQCCRILSAQGSFGTHDWWNWPRQSRRWPNKPVWKVSVHYVGRLPTPMHRTWRITAPSSCGTVWYCAKLSTQKIAQNCFCPP